MQEYSKLLGDAVHRARIRMKLTQAEVADLVDVDPRTILNIEHCKGNPKLEVLIPLVRALNIDPNEIFYPEEKAESTSVRRLNNMVKECGEAEAETIIPVVDALIKAFHTWEKDKE